MQKDKEGREKEEKREKEPTFESSVRCAVGTVTRVV